MTYFKIKIGFNEGDVIRIDETELEKAMYAFITGKPVILNRGAVNGKNIVAIVEDYHRAMGWNDGYKLGPEDYQEINSKVGKDYLGVIAGTKEKVHYLMSNGMTELIGKTKDTIRQLEENRNNKLLE